MSDLILRGLWVFLFILGTREKQMLCGCRVLKIGVNWNGHMYDNPELCLQCLCFLCCDAYEEKMANLPGNDVFGIPRKLPVSY